jgi:hypothetical protein
LLVYNNTLAILDIRNDFLLDLKMTTIKKAITEIILLDEDKKEVARHGIAGAVLLALPNAPEIEKLPKDDKGGFPIISYQIGEPQIVMALLKTFEGLLPGLFQKCIDKMENLKNNVIDGVQKGGKIWTPKEKN